MMINGKVAYWMKVLKKGEAIDLSIDDLADSAKAYMDSGFDHVRQEYIEGVINEVNSKEYPDFRISKLIDTNGKYKLQRLTDKVNDDD